MNVKNALYLVKRIPPRVAKRIHDAFSIDNPQKSILPDAVFLMILYKKRVGKRLHLLKPRTFTEKQQWLKLHDRNPMYTMMVDKYEARNYVGKLIGDQYLVPLLGVWNRPEEIDFRALPSQFVLKCNHNSEVFICLDKSKADVESMRENLNRQLQVDYYKGKREWPYKNVKRKIICEQFMQNENGENVVDYKVFCFDGEPRFIMVNSKRFSEEGVHVDMYDLDWNWMNMQDGHYPMAGDIFEKPKCFVELLKLSEILSNGISFVRVDFNYWNHKLFFGELTFFHSAGFDKFQPDPWDEILGNWLKLPRWSHIRRTNRKRLEDQNE